MPTAALYSLYRKVVNPYDEYTRAESQDYMVETRKIQKTGGSTYTVSLPKKWVTDSGLRQGDSVRVDARPDGTLTLMSSGAAEQQKLVKKMEVDDETEPKALLRELIGCYVTGYDVIEIRSRKRMQSDVRKVIHEFTRRAIGPEIIEEGSEFVVIQDVADHADLSMKKIVRRMHLMAKNMITEAFNSVKELDSSLADDVIERDDEVDRLYWFVEKQHSMTSRNPLFAAKLKTDLIESNAMISVAKALERVADHASRIAHATEMLQSSKAPEVLLGKLEGLANDATAMLDCSVDAFFRRDAVIANGCIEDSNELRKKIAIFLEDAMKQKGKVAVGLSFIAESVDRVGGYSSDIAEIAINLAQ